MLLNGRSHARSLCVDPFRGQWELPGSSPPWALPFAIDEAAARRAFDSWTAKTRGGNLDPMGHPMRAVLGHTSSPCVLEVRPCHVPFYVFTGELRTTCTGVVNLHSRDYKREAIVVPPIQLNADAGPTMGVYAGFDFRRLYVRQALSGDLTEDLLQSAVPHGALTSGQQLPAGTVVESFKMKPSFAYVRRLQERLLATGFHEAEMHMHTSSARALTYTTADRQRIVCPASEYRSRNLSLRVEQVEWALEDARLHDHGVVLLPLWAVEYTFLGQRFRAFVSALHDDPQPTVAGMRHGSDARWAVDEGWMATHAMHAYTHVHPSEPCMRVACAWHACRWAVDEGNQWKAIGELREREALSNRDWKVHRYWLGEVARVLQYEEQRPGWRFAFGGGEHAEGGAAATAEDYVLLELPSSPPPSAADVAAAFRRQAMVWHPDLARPRSSEEQGDCNERFQRIVDAHARLRRRHGVRL